MDTPEELVAEEPYPGWLRTEKEGSRPFYKSPFPRTVIRSAAILRDYLVKERAAGRMLDIEEDKFSFKRKIGVKIKGVISPPVHVGAADEVVVEGSKHRTVVELLTRDSEKITDHKKLLSSSAKDVDKFRAKNDYQKPPNFENFKKKLSEAADMKDLVHCFMEDQQGVEALRASFSDMCLAEISQVNVKNGPLVEFPPSINET